MSKWLEREDEGHREAYKKKTEERLLEEREARQHERARVREELLNQQEEKKRQKEREEKKEKEEKEEMERKEREDNEEMERMFSQETREAREEGEEWKREWDRDVKNNRTGEER